jgi:ACS family tartrate transporter-like MFS transporter
MNAEMNEKAKQFKDPLDIEKKVIGKVSRRLLPFMFILYVINYLDRINVGFAALQMNADLKFSAAVYGLGSGIFFIGYFLFEIPSNLILDRVGARVWIARIMITWGIVSSATAFIQGPRSFYLVRFLLGLAEAGFFPGMILYLTYWFPARHRAKTVALFMTATAVSGLISGPVSGTLLTMHGIGGLLGWQWLFILEGLPAVILGIVVFFYLTDRPEKAKWLSDEEKDWLINRLKYERQKREQFGIKRFMHALGSGRIWLLCLIYLSIVIGLYGVSFWMPLIIKGVSNLSDFMVGIVSVFPYMLAALGMTLIGMHSDRTGERRIHTAASIFMAAAGMLLTAYAHNPVLELSCLSLVAMGIWGTLGPFWALATSFLSGTAASGGIALINSVGNLGGFVGPYLVGVIKDLTGEFKYGLIVLAVILLIGCFLTLVVKHSPTEDAE